MSEKKYGPYTERIIEHFKNPRNMGEMEDADAVSKVGAPICGDELWLYLKVDDNDEGEPYIKEISFQSFGCAAAVATGSVITELAKGKTLKEALEIKFKDVDEYLGGLPKIKVHCSLLSCDALHDAIYQYYKKHDIQIPENLELLHEKIVKGTNIARQKAASGKEYC